MLVFVESVSGSKLLKGTRAHTHTHTHTHPHTPHARTHTPHARTHTYPHTHTGRSTDVSFRGNISNHKVAEVLRRCCSGVRAYIGLVLQPKRKMCIWWKVVLVTDLYIRKYSRILKLWKEKEMGFRFTSRLRLNCEMKWITTWLPAFHR